MNTKIKSVSVLLVTLLLGMFLGFLIKSWIVEDRFERMGKIYRPGGLMNVLQENIDLSEQQKSELQPLVEYYHKKMTTISFEQREKVKELIDSLKNEIKEILTDDQFEKLTSSFKFHSSKKFSPFQQHVGRKHDSVKYKRRFENRPDSISRREFRKMKMDSIKKQIYDTNK